MFKTYQQYSRAALLLMAAFAVLILFWGCYSTKTAISQTDKAILKYPAVVLTHLRERFPCIEKPIAHITDSVGYKQWQDSVRRLNLYFDSLVNSFEPQIEIDTVHIPDSTKIKSLEINNRGLKKVIATRDEQIRKLNRAISNPVPVHDTVKIYVEDKTSETIIKEQERSIAALKTENATNKGKKNMWFWICMGLLAIDGMYLFSKFRKPQIPLLSK